MNAFTFAWFSLALVLFAFLGVYLSEIVQRGQCGCAPPDQDIEPQSAQRKQEVRHGH